MDSHDALKVRTFYAFNYPIGRCSSHAEQWAWSGHGLVMKRIDGNSCAERFAKEGYDVFIGSRTLESSTAAVERLSAEYGVFAKGYQTEIFNEENVKSIFADIRAQGYLLDTLVLNAADLGIGQVSLDVDYEGGMGVSIGRLRPDSVYDWKFIGLSHNTLRGAAGGAVLCAETLVSMGYIRKK